MRRPDVITPTRLAGRAGVKTNQTASAVASSSGAAAAVKPDLLAAHYCVCRTGATCIFCLRWDRIIRRIEARQAQQRQALGVRAHAGGY